MREAWRGVARRGNRNVHMCIGDKHVRVRVRVRVRVLHAHVACACAYVRDTVGGMRKAGGWRQGGWLCMRMCDLHTYPDTRS